MTWDCTGVPRRGTLGSTKKAEKASQQTGCLSQKKASEIQKRVGTRGKGIYSKQREQKMPT